MGQQPKLDPRVSVVVQTFGELIKDHHFRGSLDALSVDVLEQCTAFFTEHRTLILQRCPDASPADMVSAVVGWILGMPAGKAVPANRVNETFQHNAIAAFVSAWSAENAARVWARETH